MRVDCPSCVTSYEIADSAIGPKGRKLRCGKCSLVWHIALPEQTEVEPPEIAQDDFSAFESEFSEEEVAEDDEDSMAAAFDELNEEAAEDDLSEGDFQENDLTGDGESDEDGLAASADDDETGRDPDERKPGILAGIDADLFASQGIRKVSDGDDDQQGNGAGSKDTLAAIEANVASALAEANEVRSIEAVAARGSGQSQKAGAKKRTASDRWRKSRGWASLAASLVLVAAAILLRTPIVRAVPDLASLYASIGLEVNLRGLSFRDIRMLRDVSNGGPVFVVEGLVENVSDRTVRLPEVLFSLRDDAKSELFSWTSPLSLTALPAGEVTRFKTELTTAPAIATDILVRFNDIPHRRAGL